MKISFEGNKLKLSPETEAEVLQLGHIAAQAQHRCLNIKEDRQWSIQALTLVIEKKTQ